MEINDAIYAKALKIIEEEKKKKNYVQTCLEAEICPVCGAALKARDTEATREFKCPECKYNNYIVY